MVPSLPSSPRRSPSGRSAPITVPFAVLEPEQPMFESVSDRFEGILTRLRGRGRLSEADVDEVLREIRTALLEADVEIGVVRTFTDAVRARCVGLELSQALSPGQQDDRRGTAGVGDLEGLAAQDRHQLLVDDLDDLLAGLQG